MEDELVSTQMSEMTDLFSIFLRREILVNKVKSKTLFKGQEISESIFFLEFISSKKANEKKLSLFLL